MFTVAWRQLCSPHMSFQPWGKKMWVGRRRHDVGVCPLSRGRRARTRGWMSWPPWSGQRTRSRAAGAAYQRQPRQGSQRSPAAPPHPAQTKQSVVGSTIRISLKQIQLYFFMGTSIQKVSKWGSGSGFQCCSGSRKKLKKKVVPR